MNKSPPVISAIVAMGENRVIGNHNQLPWYLPADLKHFKAVTTGHAILMGRKTYESIGRPLPNRTNIILTRNANFVAPGCIIASSLEAAIQSTPSSSQTKLFIIGGAQVYRQCMPYVEHLYLTMIHYSFEGDTYFPNLDQTWQEIARETHLPDTANEYTYSFIQLARRPNL
jgi:dihydrofolate reductase